MSVDVDLQVVACGNNFPDREELIRWVNAAADDSNAEVVVRIVDEEESRNLNATYRGKDKSTNVLSFPFEAPVQLPEMNLLGDLVMCAPVIIREAAEQGKDVQSHWAHMAIHGTLHLLGYDHQNDAQAAEMEGREKEIMMSLGFPAPYQNDE